MKNRESLIGHLFDYVTVIGVSKTKIHHVLCRCICGKEWEVYAYSLKSGETKSCGCRLIKHGDKDSREHAVWRNMRYRCNTPTCHAWASYGGRGIKICKEWDSYETFLQDMGRRPSPKHQLDRIDTNGDYEPSNCRWATPKEQANNLRKTIKLNYNGLEYSTNEWGNLLGIKGKTILSGLKKGKDISYYIEKYGFHSYKK